MKKISMFLIFGFLLLPFTACGELEDEGPENQVSESRAVAPLKDSEASDASSRESQEDSGDETAGDVSGESAGDSSSESDNDSSGESQTALNPAPQTALCEMNEEEFLKDSFKATKAIFGDTAEVFAENSELGEYDRRIYEQREKVEVIENYARDFSLDYLGTQEKGKNFIFSPASAFLCMSMYATGLEEEGANEMAELLLNGESDFKALGENFEIYLAAINSTNINQKEELKCMKENGEDLPDPKTVPDIIRVENLLLAEERYSYNEEFVKNLKPFKPNLFTVNFEDDYAELIPRINQWAELKTSGMIDQLLKGDEISQDSILALFNLIYFKDQWEIPFSKDLTSTKEFKSPEGPVDCEMMQIEDFYSYYADEKAQYIKLPYQSGATMTICLPRDENADLTDFSESFLKDDMNLQVREGKFEMPRFNFKNDFDLMRYLEDKGLDKALAGSSLNAFFAKVPQFKPFLSNAKQKTAIKVDEEGTTAAAITMMLAKDEGMINAENEKFEMILDHPFLFKIEIQDITCFLGAVYNPSLSEAE